MFSTTETGLLLSFQKKKSLDSHSRKEQWSPAIDDLSIIMPSTFDGDSIQTGCQAGDAQHSATVPRWRCSFSKPSAKVPETTAKQVEE
jgi:hypothetical protein